MEKSCWSEFPPMRFFNLSMCVCAMKNSLLECMGCSNCQCTLFSKRSAHWFYPVLPVTPGHWPWPQVISLLFFRIPKNGVFCILLLRPFDKLDMTWRLSQWPWVTGRTAWNQCALRLEKRVVPNRVLAQWMNFHSLEQSITCSTIEWLPTTLCHM